MDPTSIYHYLKLSLSPATGSDTVLYAIPVILLTFIATKYTVDALPVKRRLWRLISLVATPITVCAFYVLLVQQILPYCRRIPEEKIGVLLPPFSGAPLNSHYGTTPFNEILKTTLNIELASRYLNGQSVVKTCVEPVQSMEQSIGIRDKYRGDVVLWGHIVELESEARAFVTLDPGPIAFICTLPDKTSTSSLVDVAIYFPYTIDFRQGSYSIDKLVEAITDGLIMSIVAKLNPTDLLMSEQTLREHPEALRIYRNTTLEPFFLQQRAFAFARNKEFVTSAKLFSDSFDMFIAHLADRRNLSDYSLSKIPDSATFARFAAVSKYQEGYYLLQAGDTISAVPCFKLAAITDPVFKRWQFTGHEDH